MLVRIYIVCYNEEILLPITVNHYRKMFNNCVIHIIDNQSTDNSVKIAKELGCEIIILDTNGEYKENELCKIRNNIWKNVLDGWIIVCDMDELLLINDKDLEEEEIKGTTILKVKGMQMVADSKSETLNDLDIFEVNKGYHHKSYDKHLIFHRNSIFNMNWGWGNHLINPVGRIQFSEKVYYLYHFARLGVKWIYNRYQVRHTRCISDRIGNPEHLIDLGVPIETVEKELEKDFNQIDILPSIYDYYKSIIV